MLKILWIILGVGTCVLQSKSSFVKVTRGIIDSINSNIHQTSIDGLTCDKRGFCQCKKSTATYIFASESLTGKCVRDYEIINDRSNGKFLPHNGKCIGVTDNEKVGNLNCRDDDLSVRWIWTINEQMLNLKALKCLKGEKITGERRTRRDKERASTQLVLEQCDMNDLEQKWGCKPNAGQDVENRGVDDFALKWIVQGNDSYFQTCNETIYSYQGCHRFSDGNFMTLINNVRCDTRYNDTCGINIKIQAPIATQYSSCQLDWTKSKHTISGFIWNPFNESLEGVKLGTTLNPVILQIENKSSLISKWQGHLFRLYIECKDRTSGRSENHCALLKIQGSATDQIPIGDTTRTLHPPSITPLTTPSTTSPTKSNSTPSMTLGYNMNMTSVFTTSLNLSTGTQDPNINSKNREDKNLSIILPIVISAVVLFCILLAVAIVIVFRRRKRKTDSNQNEEHVYEETHPVDNGPVSPIYMEVDDIKRSKKSNGSRKIRNKSQSNQEPPESPFYHTLERPDGVEENVIYEELDEVAKPPSPKAFEKELDV